MTCPVCKIEMQIENESLHAYVCENCGHRYRDYQGDNFEFQKKFHLLYKRNKNEITKEGKISPLFHKARQKIVDERMELVKRYLRPDMSAFDIGAGAGTFAKVLEPYVDSVFCLEIEDFLVNEIARLGFPVLQANFLSASIQHAFDITFAWHVLEHVRDFRSFISKAAQLTKEYFIVEVPTDRVFKEKYEGHIHYFSETSLNLALSEFFDVKWIGSGVQQPAIFAVCKKELL